MPATDRFPLVKQVAREAAIVLAGALLAAMCINQIPQLRAFVHAAMSCA